MKRVILILLAVIMTACTLAGCGNKTPESSADSNSSGATDKNETSSPVSDSTSNGSANDIISLFAHFSLTPGGLAPDGSYYTEADKSGSSYKFNFWLEPSDEVDPEEIGRDLIDKLLESSDDQKLYRKGAFDNTFEEETSKEVDHLVAGKNKDYIDFGRASMDSFGLKLNSVYCEVFIDIRQMTDSERKDDVKVPVAMVSINEYPG